MDALGEPTKAGNHGLSAKVEEALKKAESIALSRSFRRSVGQSVRPMVRWFVSHLYRFHVFRHK